VSVCVCPQPAAARSVRTMEQSPQAVMGWGGDSVPS